MRKMIRIKEVQPLDGFRVRLTFTDDSAKEIDLSRFLHGPIFDLIRNDPDYFRTIHIDPIAGTVMWDNGADIDPDVLYKELTPAWMEKKSAAA
jgi:hypothetical protein